MQTLQILDGAGTFLRPLDGQPIVLGAAAAADVPLAADGVAARHVRIEFVAGVPWVHALEGEVRLNGRTVERAALELGDRIEIGQAVLVVGTSVARSAQPEDVLAAAGTGGRGARRRATAPPRRSRLPIAIAAAVAVAVALFLAFGSGGGGDLPVGFVEFDRLRRAGSFELAREQADRLRRDWATDVERQARLQLEVARLDATMALVQSRRAAILAEAGQHTYAEVSDELQRDERAAADEDVRIAARILRASLSQLLRDVPAARGAEPTPRPAANPSAAPPLQPVASTAATPNAAKPQPVEPAAPIAVAPLPAAATTSPSAPAPSVAAPPASVSGADVAAVLQATTDLVAAGQFRQALAQLDLALGGAAADDATQLRARIAALRATAKAAADQLIERARGELAAGRFEAILAALTDATTTFPSGLEFAGLATMLDEVQREQRVRGTGVDHAANIRGAVDEVTRRASLVAVASAFEQTRVAEEAGDYAGAAAPLRAAVDRVRERDPTYATQIQLRVDELEAIAALQVQASAFVARGRGIAVSLRSGRSGQLHSTVGGPLQVHTSDGDAEVAFGDLAPNDLVALVATARLDALAQLGAAALLYRGDAAKEAEGLLAQLLRADASQKDRIDRAIANGRGEPLDPRGYRLRGDGFVALAVIDAEKTAGKVLTRIDAAMRSKDPGARAAFVTEVLALGPTGLEPVVIALHRSLQKEMDQLERSSLRRQLERIAEQRRQLDAARAFAKELIYDEVKYFYPYSPPQVSAERYAEYVKVQAEVDARVAAVREIWNDDRYRVKVPASVCDSLSRIDWVADVLREVGEYDALSVLSIEWARALPVGEVIGLHNYCSGPAEREQFELWQRIEAYNQSLGKQIEAGEREQLQITNDYRRMFGHRPLAMHLQLCVAARGHAEEMSRLGYFSHFSPTAGRRTPSERMQLAGYRDGVSENIALNDSAAGAHAAWCRSSGHHRNLLMATHTEVGTTGYGRYWVQNFGTGRGYVAAIDALKPTGR